MFFDAPVFVVASGYPLDGGLAGANMELVANAEGIGVLLDRLAQHGISMGNAAQKWLEIGKSRFALVCFWDILRSNISRQCCVEKPILSENDSGLFKASGFLQHS